MSDKSDNMIRSEGLAGQELRMLGPVSLAFLGDAVFSLMVREHLIRKGITQAGRLHRQAVAYVSAGAQAAAAGELLSVLTEEEQDVYRRGRNANTTHVPKNAGAVDYRHATGLEALFGYLYLKGRTERLRELFDAIVTAKEAKAADKR